MKSSVQHVVIIEECEQIKVANCIDIKKKSTRHEVKVKLNKNGTKNSPEKSSNKETDAYRALKKSFNFIEFFGMPLGWSVDYEWNAGARSWFVIGYLIFTWSQFLYSQFLYFEKRQYMKIFEVFAVYGVAISCFLKVRCFLSYHKELCAVFKFSFKLCRETVGKHAEKLANKQRDILKLAKGIAFSAFLSAWIYIFYPIKVYIDHRELMSLLPIEIMFTDQSILSGFLIANTFMVIMGFYAVFGCLYMGLHFVAVISNYAMQVDMIEFDIKELDELWRNKTKSSPSERHRFLINICRKCQDKDTYITEIKKIFDNKIYLFFCFGYVSQVICLYEIKADNWIPGYGIAFGLFIEMMFYCFIGTRCTIENERLCYIFTQSKWYTYDVYSQKIFLLLLHSCMTANELWIGPLAPLSVYTGTEVIKSIYSYYTLLMEVM